MRRRALGLLFAIGLTSAPAHADDCEPVQGFSPCIDVDNVWGRPGNGLFFMTAPTTTTPEGEVSVGMTVGYQRRPFRLELPGAALEPREVFVVDNAVGATYTLALGVTDRLEVTVAAPVTFYQDGAGYFVNTGSDEVLARSVVRDPRFGFALALLQRDRRADAEGFALASRFEIAAPLGDGEAFAGARGATFVPGVSASYRYDRVEAGAEIGARIRGTEPLGPDVWGTQLVTALGVNVLIWEPLRLSASAEAWALPVLADQSEGTSMLVPAEWNASVRAAPFFEGDIFFQVGAGTSIPFTSFAASSPEVRVLASFGYSPLGLDTDEDGVLDRNDRCPTSREDKDGFKDDDGCLDPDNDGDGILDADDRCRDAAETVDNFKDEDGCPDLDDDDDGIPDEEDECRNDAEDKDGTDDQDGCPDGDDDNDGIADAKDTCPRGAEDKDGFNDADGCPDPDNDGDGVPDDKDRCKGQAEDLDDFADNDGCPDPDNDGDGILDTDDQCPIDAETLDGRDDDDGCPEKGAKSIAALVGTDRIVVDGLAKFKPKRADSSAELERQLRIVARVAKGRGPDIVLIVEGYGDSPTDPGGEALGLKRALLARKILAEAGFPDARITAASGDPGAKRAPGAPQLDFTIVRSSQE